MSCTTAYDCWTCTEIKPREGHPDRCACGCCSLNGVCQVSTCQMILLIANLFSTAALADCRFVTVYDPRVGTRNPGLGAPEGTAQHLGFLFFERPGENTCYWFENAPPNSNPVQSYMDFLGSDWDIPRLCMLSAFGLGWIFWFYTLLLCCSAHVQGVRLFMAFLVSGVLTVLQSLSFLLLGTEFCAEAGCGFSRSSGFSIAAAISYLLAGSIFLLMDDYPGRIPTFPSKKQVQSIVDIRESMKAASNHSVKMAPIMQSMLRPSDIENNEPESEEQDLSSFQEEMSSSESSHSGPTDEEEEETGDEEAAISQSKPQDSVESAPQPQPQAANEQTSDTNGPLDPDGDNFSPNDNDSGNDNPDANDDAGSYIEEEYIEEEEQEIQREEHETKENEGEQQKVEENTQKEEPQDEDGEGKKAQDPPEDDASSWVPPPPTSQP